MRLVEIDVAAVEPYADADVWLCWAGEVPLGAIARASAARQVELATELPAHAPPSISAVVCTRDRPEALRACLARLAGQRCPADEILVVDNGTDPGLTWQIADEFGAGCVRENRIGVRFARNRGLEAAGSEVVAYLDDDCLPVTGWTAALRHAFATVPEAACCTGPVVAAELTTEAQRLMESRGGFCKGFERRVFTRDSHAHVWRHYPLQSWIYGTGANMAFRRDTLRRAGGFAADLPRGEDLDAFFRVVRDGHALVYEPCAAVTHDHLRDYAQLRQRLFGWGYAYSAYLSRVAAREPVYRRRALREIAGFLGFQLRERWWPTLRGRGELPRDLVTAELFGALAGVPGYWRDRFLAARGRGLTAEDAEG